MHYSHNEYDAAWKVGALNGLNVQLISRQLLAEAIIVARTSGDKITLQHCIRWVFGKLVAPFLMRSGFSMLHRLPPSSDSKVVTNEIQPDLQPLEVLYDVRKLIDPHNVIWTRS